MTRLDPHYHRRRERQERDIARRCADPAVAAVHRSMADGYAKLVRETEEAGPAA